jgi:N-ethylmaleimide reductase
MVDEILHPLLQPRRLGGLLVPNRVVIVPLTRGRANDPEHVTDDLVRQYYEQRATVGFIISEVSWISEDQGWLAAPAIASGSQRRPKINLTTTSSH